MNTPTRGTCKTCGGKGYLIRARSIGRGQFVREDETCPRCDGSGDTPEPSRPALTVTDSFEIAGHRVTAPGFNPDSFDRAIKRAHDAGLELAATDTPAVVIVTNPTNHHRHTTTRRTCTCRAGQSGRPCMHRAFACFMADIIGALPARTTAAA